MLNVRSNLMNSFFAQKYDCTHRIEITNRYGEAVITENPFTINASIQPTKGQELYLFPDSALLTENITIYSLQTLVSSAASGLGDIVIYQGNRYQVSRSSQWSTHCVAIATLEPINAE